MKLTPRDHIALMLTGFSQRQIAALSGVSPRSIGRYLKGEREPKADPAGQIEAAFTIFKDMARDNARAINVPFLAPVWIRRPIMRNGVIGDRVIIDGTEHMRTELREAIIANAWRANRFDNVSIRSMIDLRSYFKNTEKAVGRSTIRTPSEQSARSEIARQIRDQITLAPIYTPYEALRPVFPIVRTLDNLGRKLRERHEPATSEPGTALADAILFQLTPAKNEARKPANKPRAQSRRNIRGRGNK